MSTWQSMSKERRRWAVYRKVLHLHKNSHDAAILEGLISEYHADCSIGWVCQILEYFQARALLDFRLHRLDDGGQIVRMWYPVWKTRVDQDHGTVRGDHASDHLHGSLGAKRGL